MIDLHNHILPGVDDGAADLAESVAIARQFAAEGVVRIAATPHNNTESGPRIDAAAVREKVQSLRLELEREQVGLTVEPGQEIFLTPHTSALLAEGAACALGDGKSVLVEVPFETRPTYLEEALFRLQLAGYQPILAHPERYSFVHRDPASLDDLVARGVVLQLTAPALLGEYGKGVRTVAERLVRRRLYALAASDRHHPEQRRSLEALHQRLTTMVDAELADLLLRHNPAHVLDGSEIVVPEPPGPAQRTSLFSRLFRDE